MNRNLLLAGGGLLVAGGLAYWYLSQQNGDGVGCAAYTTEYECVANGCYWYFNRCNRMPHGVEPCENLGECYPGVTGWQRCDMFDNLCRCNGNTWDSIEEDSQICRDDVTRGMCAVNLDGLVMCLETSQQGSDECGLTPGSIGEGCSCAVGDCHPAAWCDPIKEKCWRRAMNLPISATEETWYGCERTDVGNTCYFALDKTYGALNLSGHFGYKWCIPSADIQWWIHGYYNETGVWRELGYGRSGIVWSPEGEFDIGIISFPEQAIDYLAFTTWTSELVNTHPKYFIGHLSF